MGGECSHEKTEEIKKIHEYYNPYSEWKYEIYKVRCKNCSKKFNTEYKKSNYRQ